ncbi:MAG TPA: sulfurtransferase complex subunit TusC [Cellvibrio sp.]|nr:sulfurtransferase complex subunit TusC [Cellvibrio sp.]
MAEISKKLLFVSRHAPYGSSIAKEALDAILAASAYNQQLSLLFMDEGVFQLLPAQEAQEIGQKSLAAMLPALSLYDIDEIYVHQESLQARQIESRELVLDNIKVIDSAAVHSLLARQHQLLSF